MMLATRSPFVLSPLSEDCLVENNETPTSTRPAQTVIEIGSGPAASIEDELISSSELMRLWSGDETDQAWVREGRQWVADALYGDEVNTLRTYRLRQGFSQAELAAHVLTSQSHIARIESGSEDIRLSTARKIANVLGIALDELENSIDQQRQINSRGAAAE